MQQKIIQADDVEENDNNKAGEMQMKASRD